jgi:hypothetical protein
MDERREDLALQAFLLALASDFFMCHEVLQHGASGFTSHQKECGLQIFIALKNPSPQLGLNP